MSNRKKFVLLVEDDDSVREVLKVALKARYHVLEASGCQDVKKLNKKHIDLAIVDYVLSDTNGFEVIELLRERKPKLPVIMITGYGNEDVAIHAIRSKANDYLKKPIDLEYLNNRLSEILW